MLTETNIYNIFCADRNKYLPKFSIDRNKYNQIFSVDRHKYLQKFIADILQGWEFSLRFSEGIARFLQIKERIKSE